MTEEELKKIFDDSRFTETEGDNAVRGLLIIQKYLPKSGIEGAEHDVIFSCNADDLLKAGLTLEDAKMLGALNWHISTEYADHWLACFV